MLVPLFERIRFAAEKALHTCLVRPSEHHTQVGISVGVGNRGTSTVMPDDGK